MRQALGLQLNVPYVDLDRIDADPSLARLINSNYARRQMLVPIARVGQMLTVCMDDPTNTVVIDELAASTGQVVNVVTSAQAAIKRAFQRFYGQPMDAAPPPAAAPSAVDFVQPLDESGSRRRRPWRQARSRAISSRTTSRARAPSRPSGNCSRSPSTTTAATSTWRRWPRGVHVRFRIDGILQELELGPLQEICNRGGAADHLAHQDPGQARHRRAATAAGRRVPRADRAQREAGAHRLSRVDPAGLLRRELRAPRPRQEEHADVDRAARVLGAWSPSSCGSC